MIHTIMMLVHKDFEQAKQLIQFYTESSVNVVVHIDAKQKPLQHSLLVHFKDVHSVVVINDSIDVNWSGMSMVRAELILMSVASQKFPETDYFHLVSGDCLPLETPCRWDGLLNGASYLESSYSPEYEWRIRQYMPFGESKKNRTFFYRLTSLFFRRIQHPLPPRNNFGSEAKYKGSQWFSITGQDVRLVLEYADEEFLKKFRMTRCADEHFMQIIFNKLDINFNNKDLRYIVWRPGMASPENLEIDQVHAAQRQGKYLFARKVRREIQETFLRGVK